MTENEKMHDVLKKSTKDCTFRQSYHIMPPVGWMNDPNGFVCYKGEYHLFYQFNPFEPVWGTIHWGHYKSKDLVHWEELPVALAPDEVYDKDGCFSGSALVVGEELKLFYTGNIFTGPHKETDLLQTQCMASSSDGIAFNKYSDNPIVSYIEGVNHFRDPCVWQKGELFYMALGTQTQDHLRGRAVLYRSDNLVQWQYVGCMSESDGTLGYMWECPSVFELEGKDVLIVSPQGVEKSGEYYNNLHQSGYMVGELNYETAEFKRDAFMELDRGFDYYAPQILRNAKGRCIVIAWMDMWESDMPTVKNNWSGTMTLPREIHFNKNGKLNFSPVEELKQLRSNPVEFESVLINGEEELKGIMGESIELQIEFDVQATQAQHFGVALRVDAGHSEKTVLSFDKYKNQLVLDRNSAGIGPCGIRKITFDKPLECLHLQIFLDHSSLEVFVNGGEYVMSARIYPHAHSKGIYFFGEGVRISKLSKWDL